MLVRFGWFGQSFGLVLSAMFGGFSLFFSCFEILSAFSPVSARKKVKRREAENTSNRNKGQKQAPKNPSQDR